MAGEKDDESIKPEDGYVEDTAELDAGVDDAGTGGESEDGEADKDEPSTMAEAISQGLDSDGEEKVDGDDEKVDADTTDADGESSGDVAGADDSPEKADLDAAAEDADGDGEDSPEEHNLEELYDSQGLKGKTKARFEKLSEYSKSKDTELSEANEKVKERDDLFSAHEEMIAETGADSEQYLQMLNLTKMINNNPKEALIALKTTMDVLARDNNLTYDDIVIDHLEKHPDLRKKVDEGYMDENTAIEVAGYRDNNKKEKRADETHQQQATIERGATEAKSNIAQLLNKWEGDDVDFIKKVPVLEKAALFCGENLPPEKWEKYMKDEYTKINDMARTMGSNKKGRRVAPLRSTNVPSGEGEAKTMLEAINQGLG